MEKVTSDEEKDVIHPYLFSLKVTKISHRLITSVPLDKNILLSILKETLDI